MIGNLNIVCYRCKINIFDCAECTNKFVQVSYNKSIISCVFQNQSDTSKKLCCVTHRLCDQEEPKNVQECNNSLPYRILNWKYLVTQAKAIATLSQLAMIPIRNSEGGGKFHCRYY